MFDPVAHIGRDCMLDRSFPVGLPSNVAHPVIRFQRALGLTSAEIDGGSSHPRTIKIGSALLASDLVKPGWRLEPLQQRKRHPRRDRAVLCSVTLQQHPSPGFDTGREQMIHVSRANHAGLVHDDQGLLIEGKLPRVDVDEQLCQYPAILLVKASLRLQAPCRLVRGGGAEDMIAFSDQGRSHHARQIGFSCPRRALQQVQCRPGHDVRKSDRLFFRRSCLPSRLRQCIFRRIRKDRGLSHQLFCGPDDAFLSFIDLTISEDLLTPPG